MRLTVRLLALPAALALVLTGCSGGDDEAPAGNASPSGEESVATVEEPYLPVPDGVELTAQGETLKLGETATVAWELEQGGKVGALDIKVTSLEAASFREFVGWDVTPKIKKTAPYFVRATVTNVGKTDLGSKKGALPVPLYGVDDQNRLIESSLFGGSFKPCQGAAFPEKFKTGDTMKACMVYLTPDKAALEGASFRPVQEFNPILWEGKVVKSGAGDKKAGDKKAGDKKADDTKSGGQQDDGKKSDG